MFVVKLQSGNQLPVVIDDPDPLVTPSEIMESKDAFFGKCCEENWEFSSLRRATYRYHCIDSYTFLALLATHSFTPVSSTV